MSERVQQTRTVWSAGDYPQIAERFEPVAEELLDAVGEIAEFRLLDVAAGTGNVALAAAGRGASVLATDLTPRMVELGRARGAAGGLEVEWCEADASALPLADHSVDVITSCFGLMFVPDPPAAISELCRVLRPGGRLGIANWEPNRVSQKLFEPLRRRRPLPPPDPDLGDWGRPEILELWLAAGFTGLVCQRRPFAWDFSSAQHAVDFFLSASPLHVSALAELPAAEQAAVRTEMQAMLDQPSVGGRVSLSSPYLLATAKRASS